MSTELLINELIVKYVELCCHLNHHEAALRLKWLINADDTSQMDVNTIMAEAVKEKFRSL